MPGTVEGLTLAVRRRALVEQHQPIPPWRLVSATTACATFRSMLLKPRRDGLELAVGGRGFALVHIGTKVRHHDHRVLDQARRHGGRDWRDRAMCPPRERGRKPATTLEKWELSFVSTQLGSSSSGSVPLALSIRVQQSETNVSARCTPTNVRLLHPVERDPTNVELGCWAHSPAACRKSASILTRT